MTLRHKTRLTLLGKVLKNTLFAINAIFTRTLLGQILKKTLFAINAIFTNKDNIDSE